MSDHEAPDLHPVQQLEQLVRNLGEELAAFRRRAMQAESRLRAYDSSTRTGDLFAEQRAAQLEKENQELRARLDWATSRTRLRTSASGTCRLRKGKARLSATVIVS